MGMCENCDLCLKNCPTGAIANDRFIIHTDKCITLHNGSNEEFPKWLNSKCHNSIRGCMCCQLICPANKNYIKNIEDFAKFDDCETRMILSKTQLDELPQITYKKLESINFIEYYNLLARNLNVLIGYRH
ncbi:4Fe-4S double cluster binding domain-containing protein [Clostridium akagii]|uniref:4Fe-4S double cluster binding domain-containing protein n=1 Tax=Clostridium akagii TaxID=91623 RepID=UPI000A895148|nr:4Fe-4S double cluster binding domain-containing protein [Clostridium akagii]